jgi:hypothetical protein
MQLTTNEKIWLSLKDIQDKLSVSKTTAHQISRQIADEDEDPIAVIKFGRCLRVSEDALMRFIERHSYPMATEPSEKPEEGL